ncbi:MAG TPA: hypothetical protein VGK77_23895, partial [Candidatus Binatia bacterium]
ALPAWKRVVPGAPPTLPGRGGAQQLGIYKAVSVFESAAQSAPTTTEPAREDKPSQYIADALFNAPAFQQNVESYINDPNEPALLRYLVGGVRALDRSLEALVKLSPLEIDLQRAKEIEIAANREEQARRAYLATQPPARFSLVPARGIRLTTRE